MPVGLTLRGISPTTRPPRSFLIPDCIPKPARTCSAQVYFFPEERMPSFTETLFVRAGATSDLSPLLSISGQSTGMEVALGVDALPFGTVCAGSQRTQRLGLENRGDLPARFRWVAPIWEVGKNNFVRAALAASIGGGLDSIPASSLRG